LPYFYRNTSSKQIIESIDFTPALNAADGSPRYGPVQSARIRVLRRYLEAPPASIESLNNDFALITLSEAAPAGTGALAVVPGFGQQARPAGRRRRC